MNSQIPHGFQILPSVFAADEIHVLRQEADRVASDAGSACVRHLRDRSGIFRNLARSPEILKLLPNAVPPPTAAGSSTSNSHQPASSTLD